MKISDIFNKITDESFDGYFYYEVFICLFFIISRTILVTLLRKYAFNKIFNKKIQDERYLVREFIIKRTKKLNNNNDNDLNLFKEKLINSTNLAAVNFDIPIISIVSELIFAIGGVFILLNIFGELLVFNLPILILLLLSSKIISKKLNNLGRNFLNIRKKIKFN